MADVTQEERERAAQRELPERDAAREWLESMMLIRRFEERAGEMYAKAKVGGFLHLAIGEEATIVGAVRAMRDEDYLISTYRSHGHALSRGADPNKVMAELFGRESGVSHGRGGSMHMFDLENRFMGGYGIVGGNLPLAAGMALSSDYRGTEEVTLCVFGDGASNQGTFGETLNLAALWRLPVVFMVTNNQFGMGTALERHSAVTDLHRRGEGFGVPGMRCDGMDVLDTYAVIGEALEEGARGAPAGARRGDHLSLPRPLDGRPRGVPHQGAGRRVAQEGPDRGLRAQARGGGHPRGGRGREDGRRPIVKGVDEAVRFADKAKFPPPESLYDDIYVLGDQVKGWYSVDERSAGVHRGREGARARRGGARPDRRLRRGGRAGLARGPRLEKASRRAGRGRRRERGRRLMAVVRYREALNQALREEMQRDENVYLMGEDIGVFNGAFKVTNGLLEEFGEKRVRDTPISENTIVGMGVGSAMTGLRPVVELMTINFSLLALDQIVNHMATIHYMFGGQVRVPMVVRMPQGAGHQLGPTHSHSWEALFLHVPGMLVAVPSTAADAKGLLKSAIRDDNPVVFIEHEYLYGQRGEVPDDEDHTVDFGQAAIRREGDDVTIIGISRMAVTAEKAAKTLSDEHEIEAEVIDPRTLRPLDLDTILESVRKTNRVRDRRGGLAARRRRREPRGADPGAGVRLPRRARRPRHRRRPADAVLQAARADRLPARAADRRSGARDVPRPLGREPRLAEQVLKNRSGPLRGAHPCASPTEGALMRRTTVLGAAAAAALAAGSLAATGVFGSSHREAPKILADPTADNTDVYAFTAPDAPDSLTVVANWIPLEEPAGGPYFGKLDPRGPLLRQDRQHRRRARGRGLPLAVQAEVPQPELVPVRGADGRLGQRSGHQLRPDVRPLQGDVQGKHRRQRSQRIAHNVPVAPDNVGPKTIPNYAKVAGGRDHARCRGGGKTFVGPADDPFFVDLGAVFDGINIDKPGRPEHRPRQPGRRQGRRRGLQHALVRAAGAGGRGHARRQAGVRRRSAGNAVVGVWATHRAPARLGAAQHGKRTSGAAGSQVSRLGNPLINEVIIPIGQKDKFNRDVARERREELRQVRAQPGAGAPAERPVQASASRRRTGRTSSRRC